MNVLNNEHKSTNGRNSIKCDNKVQRAHSSIVDDRSPRVLFTTTRDSRLQVDRNRQHTHQDYKSSIQVDAGRLPYTDILKYTRFCHANQMMGSFRPSAGLMPVLHFQPLDLLGIHFTGPISPLRINGERRICIPIGCNEICLGRGYCGGN